MIPAVERSRRGKPWHRATRIGHIAADADRTGRQTHGTCRPASLRPVTRRNAFLIGLTTEKE